MVNFSLGLTALQSNQFALDIISQNLANANTPGYHRQLAQFRSVQGLPFNGNFLGAGVEISIVKRMRDQIVEGSLTSAISDLHSVQQSLTIEERLESLFSAGEGSIHERLNNLFNKLSELSADPSQRVHRNAVVQEASLLAGQIRDVADSLTDMKAYIAQQVESEIDSLNANVQSLIQIQKQIKVDRVTGTPNNQLDQRDQLINQIAEIVDIRRLESVQEGFGLTMFGGTVSVASASLSFQSVQREDGTLALTAVGSARELPVAAGRLSALFDLYNTAINGFQEKLDTFARTLMREIDQAHAVGVGIDGSFAHLVGTRAVDDITVPLAQSGITHDVQAGNLYFSVLDSNGDRRTYGISIDPEMDSLQAVAAKINSVPHLQAVIDPQSNLLQIIAEPGFRFDMTGSLESGIDWSSFSGSSIPRVSGTYTGDSNQILTTRIVGSGSVGITPGLSAQIIDSSGAIVAELAIGDTYEAGTPLPVGFGVMLSFSAGTVNNGDSFETTLVAQPDDTGILSALGLNSFFAGYDSTDIQVDPRIQQNSDNLATSKSGDVGDTKNLLNLLNLREQRILNEGRLTFGDFLIEVNSEIGVRVQSSTIIEQNLSHLKTQYEYQRDSKSGVDVNEELLNLAKYQKSYEAAVQVVRTIETMLDDLFRIAN